MTSFFLSFEVAIETSNLEERRGKEDFTNRITFLFYFTTFPLQINRKNFYMQQKKL